MPTLLPLNHDLLGIYLLNGFDFYFNKPYVKDVTVNYFSWIEPTGNLLHRHQPKH